MAAGLFGQDLELARAMHGLTQVVKTVLSDVEAAVLGATELANEEARSSNEFGA